MHATFHPFLLTPPSGRADRLCFTYILIFQMLAPSHKAQVFIYSPLEYLVRNAVLFLLTNFHPVLMQQQCDTHTTAGQRQACTQKQCLHESVHWADVFNMRKPALYAKAQVPGGNLLRSREAPPSRLCRSLATSAELSRWYCCCVGPMAGVH